MGSKNSIAGIGFDRINCLLIVAFLYILKILVLQTFQTVFQRIGRLIFKIEEKVLGAYFRTKAMPGPGTCKMFENLTYQR